MILKVFAVRDLKAEAFLQPFFSPSVGSAMRAFSDAVNDKNCPFNKHPADYALFEIGTYDDHDASLVPLLPVKMYSIGSDLVDPAAVQPPAQLPKEVMEIVNGKK